MRRDEADLYLVRERCAPVILSSPMGIASDLVYIVLAALLGGIIAWKFGQPLIIGYILAGIAVGPHTGGPTIGDAHDIEMLAEIGVALLLFALGLEFSLKDLRKLARIVFLATPIQLALSGLGGFQIARLLGLAPMESVWFGSIVAMSSTMVVLKCLDARNSLNTEHGRVMLGVLIAQDLAIIPLMLILPQISGDTIGYEAIIYGLFKSLLFLAAMYVIGTRFFPWLFSVIADWRSRELFLLCTLAVALGVGYAGHALGLSFAFGAFVAGMLLTETDFSHQALSDISSLRDVFGLLFFVSVGMLFDPMYLISNFGVVLCVVTTIIVCKTLSVALALALLGYRGITPWIAGFGLSQTGEFAFLLAQAGTRSGSISADVNSLVIAVAVLSMILTPALFPLSTWLYKTALRLRGKEAAPVTAVPPESIKRNHVVIIGGGVVAKKVAGVLALVGIEHVIIELDFLTGNALKNKLTEVIFGDASHPVILGAASITEARLAILTVTDINLTMRILAGIRAMNPALRVVVRVQEVEDAGKLKDFGIKKIVQPQSEAALEILRQTLLTLGFTEGKVFHLLTQVRAKNYVATEGNLAKSLKSFASAKLLDISLHEVMENDTIVGNNLIELKLRERFQISVVGILRGEEFFPNPKPDMTIQTGDILALVGMSQELAKFDEFCAATASSGT